MQRIVILGCSGSGKSTLARQLGKKLTIPVHHLDSYFWKPGWVNIERSELTEIQQEIIKQDQWILDGNYSATINIRLQAADTVVFLNYPTWRCLYGIVKRRIQYHNQTRPDMGKDCKEKLDWEFIQWVLRFQKDKVPKLRQQLEQAKHLKIIELTSPKHTKAFLENKFTL